jgi:hypothetical protein
MIEIEFVRIIFANVSPKLKKIPSKNVKSRTRVLDIIGF